MHFASLLVTTISTSITFHSTHNLLNFFFVESFVSQHWVKSHFIGGGGANDFTKKPKCLQFLNLDFTPFLALLLWVWLWSHPVVKTCFYNQLFHTYIYEPNDFTLLKSIVCNFALGPRERDTHMLLFGSYDSCVCCDGVALSKCLINVQIPNAKKSRQAKCNL